MTTSASPAPLNPLEADRWKHRPVIIVMPAKPEGDWKKLERALKEAKEDLEERAVVIYRIPPQGVVTREGKPLTPEASQALRERIKADPMKPTLILIGKDGGIKLRQTTRLDVKAVIDLIDTMPMRRAEMRE